MINSMNMKNTLLILLIVSFISCNNDEDQIEILSDNLRKRLIVGTVVPDEFTGRDSIVEYYANKLITRSESFLKYTDRTIEKYNTYDFDANILLTQINSFTDGNLSNLYQTTTYSYDENFRIQKIKNVKFKTSNYGPNLYNFGTYYEYKSDTVRRYKVNHFDNDKVVEEDLYLIKGNLDTIIDLKYNKMYLFDEQNDLYHLKYLGDSLVSSIFYAVYNYGNEKEPIINNFFGNRLNLFLIKKQYHPIYFLTQEQNKKYLEHVFYKTDRTNDNDTWSYIFDSKNRPLEMRTNFGGSVFYYYK